MNAQQLDRLGQLLRLGPIAQTIVWFGVPSTIIRHFCYAPHSRELTVELVTGQRYLCSDVPAKEAAAFRSAIAKGVYFNRHIRGRYSCRELTEAN